MMSSGGCLGSAQAGLVISDYDLIRHAVYHVTADGWTKVRGETVGELHYKVIGGVMVVHLVFGWRDVRSSESLSLANAGGNVWVLYVFEPAESYKDPQSPPIQKYFCSTTQTLWFARACRWTRWSCDDDDGKMPVLPDSVS